jgi:hypothetical protein
MHTSYRPVHLSTSWYMHVLYCGGGAHALVRIVYTYDAHTFMYTRYQSFVDVHLSIYLEYTISSCMAEPWCLCA